MRLRAEFHGIMKVWFTSDTHFGHGNIIKYENRPFSSVEEMNEALIKKWNDRVCSSDHVYHLGDFGLASFDFLSLLLMELKGYKHLILGNHDGSISRMRKMGFDSVNHAVIMNIGGYFCHLSHKPQDDIFFDYNIHGHLHSKTPYEVINKRLNISCDLTDYGPISEKEIVRKIRNYEKSCREEAKKAT